MKLILGLGNPGRAYAGNRHNIGFLALDAIARAVNAAPWRNRFQGEAAEALIGGEKCLLLKPSTYMNLSGQSAGEAARFFKLSVGDLIVFHDELDLAPAKLRVKLGGGDAGHNGLKSITQHLSGAYLRVRMGIGHPGTRELVSPYVLSDFAKTEQPWVEDLCDACAKRVALLVSGEDGRFQSDVAMLMQGRGWGEAEAKPKADAQSKKEDTVTSAAKASLGSSSKN
jgi:peptidyl-tRNA hydrolase, PTH1 family